MSFMMLIEKLTCATSSPLAMGSVIRLFDWYSGSNKCLRKRSSAGYEHDSVKQGTQIGYEAVFRSTPSHTSFYPT